MKRDRERIGRPDKVSAFACVTKRTGFWTERIQDTSWCSVLAFDKFIRICRRISVSSLCSGVADQQSLRKSSIYDCLKPTRKSTWHSYIYIDHIRPISRGGSNNIENLQILCGFCNSSKKDFITIFDQSHVSGPIIIQHPKLRSSIHISRRFLVVRMLAGGKCKTCGKKADSAFKNH